jgi:hypothetical protein
MILSFNWSSTIGSDVWLFVPLSFGSSCSNIFFAKPLPRVTNKSEKFSSQLIAHRIKPRRRSPIEYAGWHTHASLVFLGVQSDPPILVFLLLYSMQDANADSGCHGLCAPGSSALPLTVHASCTWCAHRSLVEDPGACGYRMSAMRHALIVVVWDMLRLAHD